MGLQPSNHINPFVGFDLWRLIEERCQQFSSKPFLIWQNFTDPPETWTYTRFRSEALLVAEGLQKCGVDEGSFVLIHCDNCPEVLLTLAACAALGAVAVTTNTRASEGELRYFADAVRPKLVITQPDYLEIISRAAPETNAMYVCERNRDGGGSAAPERALAFSRLMSGPGAFQPDLQPDPWRLALLQFTSGTTSRPKGVRLTHGNLLWGGRISAMHETLRSTDRHLVMLPLFHVNAMSYGVMASLWAGASIVLVPRFSASRFWDISIRHKCTWASQTGFTYKALMAQETPPTHTYRLWGNGACALPHDAAFGIETLGWYGMTETISHPIIGLAYGCNRPFAMGRPSPAYHIAVRDEAGRPVKPGNSGRLHVSGVQGVSLFDGYFENAAATRAAFDEQGDFNTEDIVHWHEDGFLSFVDRAKDMLKVGGENVATLEIERVISAVSGVADVAVIGAPHPMLDEVPAAFIVKTSPDANEANLTRAIQLSCERELADFKRPQEILFIAKLPEVTLGKTAKKDLAQLLKTLPSSLDGGRTS